MLMPVKSLAQYLSRSKCSMDSNLFFFPSSHREKKLIGQTSDAYWYVISGMSGNSHYERGWYQTPFPFHPDMLLDTLPSCLGT